MSRRGDLQPCHRPLRPRPGATLFLSLGSCALLAGCAPLGAYRGPVPVPGALTAFSPHHAADAATAGQPSNGFALAPATPLNPWLEPGSPDRAHHIAGTLAVPAARESVVVILEGDSRTGYRMQDHSRLYYDMKGIVSGEPLRMLWGLMVLPIFALEAFIPQLDGVRDLNTKLFTQRPRGGREEQVLRGIDRMLPADLLINVGDLVLSGRRGRLWEDWVTLHRDLRRRIPYLATPGNHERLYDPTARASWDAIMGPPARAERYWYALDLPGGLARFVFLDSNVLADVNHDYADSLEESLSAEQLAWADSVLAAPVQYRFLVFHHPLVSMGHYSRDWAADSVGDPVPGRRARLLEICARRGVTAVITGHEHLYHRVYMRRQDGSGFWNIITGGGGGPLYPIDSKKRARELARPQPAGLAIEPASAYGVTAYHFCRLVIPRESHDPLRLDVYRSRSGGRIELIEQLDLARAPEAR